MVIGFRLRAARWGSWLLGPVVLLCLLVLTSPAQARRGGIAASGCTGCHGPAGSGKLSMTANPPSFNPGDRVEFTLSILGNYKTGGVYLNTTDVGDLQVMANQGLTKLASGLVHNQPKPAAGGTVTFSFAWVAPAAAGAVRFNVYALGANGNNASSGDNAIDGTFDWVYGCAGKTYYLDGDGDGIGRSDFAVLGCADKAPLAYSEVDGDCDDYRKTTFPAAPELCNMRDDNCDGRIDEDAVPVELWPDADGDGYYDARTEKVGTPKIGCAGLKGWAAEPGDCRPEDPAVHSGAEETCNNNDDDCDGDVDERVRPTCGEGWCRRESPGCDLQYCMPGPPVKEKCNFLDDDCDGLTDEDADLCPGGQVCAAGECVDEGSVVLDPEGTPAGSAGAPPSGSSGSPSSGSAAGSQNGVGNSPGSSAGRDGLGSGDNSSGCALGTGTGHGAAGALGVLMALGALRRRRQRG